jgi:hypothetical protein
MLAPWKSLTKRAGSGYGARSGSANQVYGSKDPHLYQHITDPELWSSHKLVYLCVLNVARFTTIFLAKINRLYC